MSRRPCRFCQSELTEVFVDLGKSPLSNAYLTESQLHTPEPTYPLCAWVCSECFLVQLEAFETPDQIFTEYAYFSSYSTSWLEHCQCYVEMIIKRLGLQSQSQVVELASNDGYLLQYFKQRDIPVLGIDPAANVAQVANENGIPTEVAFFGVQTAESLRKRRRTADLLIGNNVLAHVPDINDFVMGMKKILAENGTITMEFPHLLRLIEKNQFDTIYHEHFSYLSLLTAERIFARHGLRLYDVEELPTHGGSIRIYACHDQANISTTPAIARIKQLEQQFGLGTMETYRGFPAAVEKIKQDLLDFLNQRKREGKTVLGYGAPAKGNTLLTYCGVDGRLLPFTVDRNIHKQGHFLPSSHLPIHAPEAIFENKPDYLLILPWNWKEEIISQMAGIRDWGGRFVVPIPCLEILD